MYVRQTKETRIKVTRWTSFMACGDPAEYRPAKDEIDKQDHVEVRGLALRGDDRRDEMRITAKRKIISPSEADGFSAKNDINVKPMKPNRKRTNGRFIFNGCPAFIAVRFRLQGNGC